MSDDEAIPNTDSSEVRSILLQWSSVD
jgi:hypothetical protein